MTTLMAPLLRQAFRPSICAQTLKDLLARSFAVVVLNHQVLGVNDNVQNSFLHGFEINPALQSNQNA
jgi:hypothetical protein